MEDSIADGTSTVLSAIFASRHLGHVIPILLSFLESKVITTDTREYVRN